MGEVSSSSINNASSGGGNEGALIHVLVIDDSLIDRKVAEKLLKSAMFTGLVGSVNMEDRIGWIDFVGESSSVVDNFQLYHGPSGVMIYKRVEQRFGTVEEIYGSPFKVTVGSSLTSALHLLFKVTTVDSGKRAMDILVSGKEKIGTSINDLKIDIILTDYCMPGMNGYDVLKAVKEDCCLKSMPVAIMSSEHDPQRIGRCLASGAEDFISKPLQLKYMPRLRSYVRPTTTIAKTGSKRKMQLELMQENKGSERRSCIAGVAVA